MAAPDPKVNVKRSDQDDRLKMLKELAKLTKPTGASAKGKKEEGGEDE